MLLTHTSAELEAIESMLLEEMDRGGRIMVRTLDKIHATSGLTYATVSEIARRLQDRRSEGSPA